jgi:hypothetical protein
MISLLHAGNHLLYNEHCYSVSNKFNQHIVLDCMNCVDCFVWCAAAARDLALDMAQIDDVHFFLPKDCPASKMAHFVFLSVIKKIISLFASLAPPWVRSAIKPTK